MELGCVNGRSRSLSWTKAVRASDIWFSNDFRAAKWIGRRDTHSALFGSLERFLLAACLPATVWSAFVCFGCDNVVAFSQTVHETVERVLVSQLINNSGKKINRLSVRVICDNFYLYLCDMEFVEWHLCCVRVRPVGRVHINYLVAKSKGRTKPIGKNASTDGIGALLILIQCHIIASFFFAFIIIHDE